MSMNAEQYRTQLLALAPPGAALPKELDSVFADLALAMADEQARVDGRADDVLAELDPRTSMELLPDWERVCALPSKCSFSSETIQERRDAVELILTAQGGQTPAFYEEAAATIGVAAKVEEFRPFCAGASSAGDPLTNEPWTHAWRMRGPEETIKLFTAGGSSAGDPLAKWGNEMLECHISRLAPAHTIVTFAYGEE